MVPGKGLEPSRLAALVPKTSVYTNFTTRARQHGYFIVYYKYHASLNPLHLRLSAYIIQRNISFL